MNNPNPRNKLHPQPQPEEKKSFFSYLANYNFVIILFLLSWSIHIDIMTSASLIFEVSLKLANWISFFFVGELLDLSAGGVFFVFLTNLVFFCRFLYELRTWTLWKFSGKFFGLVFRCFFAFFANFVFFVGFSMDILVS